MNSTNNIAVLLRALHFAADKHRDQRRKGEEGSPYINHLIEVAELLTHDGNVTDLVTLQAAILHDTLEDTQTTTEELEVRFGPEVRQVVEEVTDDKRLPKTERKRLQIEHAPGMSARAKTIKLADKISNILGIIQTPPAGWSLERRREYLNWSEQVVAGCQGANATLEKLYAETVAEGRRVLGALESQKNELSQVTDSSAQSR
ncbi:MAG: HD domain-containing protein [Candidatus Binatia bacterium]